MNKYEVVATIWDSEEKKQVKVVIGVFGKFIHARIFQKTYNTEFRANAELVQILEK